MATTKYKVRMLPTNLYETTQAHLEQMIRDQVQEGPNLDFKRELPPAWDDKAKVRFIADVVAFANSGGGDLVYGIEEDDDAVAAGIVPLALTSADEEVRRIQDFVLNLTEPRLAGTQVYALSLLVGDATGHALVVRVQKSWLGPHRSKLTNHFYVRDGLRNRQLDVPEIRGLVMRSESLAQRVRDFRADRLAKILSGDAPCKLAQGPAFVVHFVPTQSVLTPVGIDPVSYTRARSIPVFGPASSATRLNIDGALSVATETQNGSYSYAQFFRSGFYEAVWVPYTSLASGKKNLPSLGYEQDVIKLFTKYREELRFHGLNKETTVMFSILRADEVQLGLDAHQYAFLDEHQSHFDRSLVLAPDVLTAGESEAAAALKPAFDLIWQAAGFTGSRNYDHEGQWSGGR